MADSAMTESDFATIQKILKISVPSAYRRIMSAYPFHDNRPSDAYIPDSVDYVCNLNQQIQSDAVYCECWRPGLLAIGTTWGGDAFVLDTLRSNSPVFRFSQDDQTATAVADTLDEWVSRLSQWYVDFNGDRVADEYGEITSAIQASGYFCTSPEPMDGWHRICVMSRRGGGSSFWVAAIHGYWFAGTWCGNIYRVPKSVSDFCISWLAESSSANGPDFSNSIQTQYCLESVSDAEFAAIVQAN